MLAQQAPVLLPAPIGVHVQPRRHVRPLVQACGVVVCALQVHANCRLRRIYFSDKLYTEDELPPEFKIFLPIQVCGLWNFPSCLCTTAAYLLASHFHHE